MLIGQFRAKISPKGRTAFPKKFREDLGDDLVVTAGYENALMIVSGKDWRSLVEGTEGKPFMQGTARDTNRFLLGEASEVTLDEQGRFILPAYLREYAKVGEEIVFLGLNKYVEVWDKKSWEEYEKYLHEHKEEIANKLTGANV